MEKRDLEQERRQAYQEALEAEAAFLATRSLWAQNRYQQALDMLSRVERECTQNGYFELRSDSR